MISYTCPSCEQVSNGSLASCLSCGYKEPEMNRLSRREKIATKINEQFILRRRKGFDITIPILLRMRNNGIPLEAGKVLITYLKGRASCDLPEGWNEIKPTILENPSLHLRVDILADDENWFRLSRQEDKGTLFHFLFKDGGSIYGAGKDVEHAFKSLGFTVADVRDLKFYEPVQKLYGEYLPVKE